MKKIEFIHKLDNRYNLTINTEDNPLVIPSIKKGDYTLRVTSDNYVSLSKEINIYDNTTLNIRLIRKPKPNLAPYGTDYYVMVEPANTGRSSDNFNYATLSMPLVAGQEYTLSFDYERIGSYNDPFFVRVNYPDVQPDVEVKLDENVGRAYYTFTPNRTNSVNSIYIYAGHVGETRGKGAIFSRFKLEHGKASDYVEPDIRETEKQPPIIEIVTDETTSEAGYSTLNVTITENASSSSWQVLTTTEKIKYQTLPDVKNANLDVGVRRIKTKGVDGERTIVAEYEYLDGARTGNKRVISDTVTLQPINEQWEVGTKVATQVSPDNVLTQSNVSAGGSTNTYVDGSRTSGDAIPPGKTFELRQWAEPAGAMNIRAGDLELGNKYTLAFDMKNKGSKVDIAKFIIGTSFFGGNHYFDGNEVTIEPSEGQYDFTSQFKNNGDTLSYKYQFTVDNYEASDYFQVAFTNEETNTIVEIFNLKLIEGWV
ncbi:G5 domain-containing protein [Aerococcaceae bacterium DSM 111020]|nr:G5 domain-containing protein [Aerococcaceae bacterium DSM 111020]